MLSEIMQKFKQCNEACKQQIYVKNETKYGYQRFDDKGNILHS